MLLQHHNNNEFIASTIRNNFTQGFKIIALSNNAQTNTHKSESEVEDGEDEHENKPEFLKKHPLAISSLTVMSLIEGPPEFASGSGKIVREIKRKLELGAVESRKRRGEEIVFHEESE
ncbi:unnamed protein product [Vicia faba]|uniref:Uncharacterized protein n=1 Tax=Vicia faba TaxID=3906 RepID=A0AAV0YD67_VICFA|nr:unnamed protein product [Vicia faba]